MSSFYEMCDYFEFLDDLRESGETNMFGAAPYLVERYSLDIREARDILKRWMDTFSAKPLEDRVSAAQTSLEP